MTQPPQAFSGPTGQLVLHLRKPPGGMGMLNPQVLIDGFAAPAQWTSRDGRGVNTYTVPAGTRTITAQTTYLWTYGRADAQVDVAPGQTAELFYSPPLLTFIAGRMGSTPQPRPGMAVFAILMAVLVLVVVIGIAASVIGNS